MSDKTCMVRRSTINKNSYWNVITVCRFIGMCILKLEFVILCPYESEKPYT